jgi:hypothetical protein
MSTRDVVGEYPMEIEEKEGEIKVNFFPKTKTAEDPNHVTFQLRFKFNDNYRRNKIREIFEELKKIDK